MLIPPSVQEIKNAMAAIYFLYSAMNRVDKKTRLEEAV